MSLVDIKYKIEELTNDSLEEYDCPICNELMYNMEIYQCNEGHFACKSCWIRRLENKKECFECRNKIQSFGSLSRLRLLEKQLANKDISCPYKQDQNSLCETNCVEKIKIGNLDSHIKKCDFRIVKCLNEKCFATFRFNSMYDHDCQFQKVKCERCKKKIKKKSIGKKHDDECSEVEIECDKCHLLIKRINSKSHNENDCLESTMSCKYLQYGCNERFKRKDLEKHLIDPIHINLLFNFINTTIESPKKYIKKWKISNYSREYGKIRNGECLTSPIFNVENLKFKIKLYPKGETDSNLSIFLFSLNQYELSTKFSFKIKDIFKECSYDFFSNGGGFGFSSFCTQDQCKSFLIKDTLTIKLKLEILDDIVEILLS